MRTNGLLCESLEYRPHVLAGSWGAKENKGRRTMAWVETRAPVVPWYTTWIIRSGRCELVQDEKIETFLNRCIITSPPGESAQLKIYPAADFGWIEWGVKVDQLRLRHDSSGYRYIGQWPGELQPSPESTWESGFPIAVPEWHLAESEKLIHRICMQWWKSPMDRAFCDGILGQWIAGLLLGLEQRNHALQSHMIESIDPWVSKAIQQAVEMLSSIVQVKDWADAMGIHEQTLYQRCVHATEKSPGHILDQLKLDKACKMLSDNNPIELVSRECGFSSRRTFTRWFKAKMGHPPSKYN